MTEWIFKLLSLINGKKTIIVGILALVVQYLTAEQLIGQNLAYFLVGVLTLLGGAASYQSKKLNI